MGRPRTAPALLMAGADVLDQVGLLQGDYWPLADGGRPYCHGEPCCLLGALVVAAGFGDDNPGDVLAEPVAMDAIAAVDRVLGLDLDPLATVGEWSDQPGRTAAEVAAALRAAAATLTEGSR